MSKIVLHVDDSATMQMVADITFRGTEYTCVSARSVDEALEKAKGQKPALVLADSQMPGKTGYDLCLALKSDPKFSDVPVVILCGNAQPFDTARGTQVGADGTLPKPWDSQVMLEKVTEALDKAGKGVAKPGGATAAPVAAAAPPAAAAAAPPTGPSPATATSAASAPSPVAAVAAAAAKGVPQPPRSATIMGMPTIKMPPAGGAPAVPVTSATPPAAVAPAAAAAPPPSARPPAPATSPMGSSTLRAPAVAAAGVAAPVSAPVAAPVSAPAAASNANAPARAPMVSATPTKRSALVERTLAKMAARLAEASGLEPGSPELLALLKLSTEVVERIVWEVVPELAEQIIRENLEHLAANRRN